MVRFDVIFSFFSTPNSHIVFVFCTQEHSVKNKKKKKEKKVKKSKKEKKKKAKKEKNAEEDASCDSSEVCAWMFSHLTLRLAIYFLWAFQVARLKCCSKFLLLLQAVVAYKTISVLCWSICFQDSEDEWVEAPFSPGGGDKAWKAEHEATPTSSSASTNQVRTTNHHLLQIGIFIFFPPNFFF